MSIAPYAASARSIIAADVCSRGDVGLCFENGCAGVAQPLRRFAQLRAVRVREDEPRTLGGAALGRCKADPLRCAGHDRGSSFESHADGKERESTSTN
jgi:hypothetical protein